MLEYLIDNIFVEFGGRIFQQTIGIPMGTTCNCAPLLADLFLYSYEAEFIQSLFKAGKKHLAQQGNFTYRYIDDTLSLKNTTFAEYVIDKPWLLSRFWVYCKLYHCLVTFHCLTPNEAEPSLGQTVKGHQIMV